MNVRTTLAALALTLGAAIGSSPQSKQDHGSNVRADLETFLPPPSWVMTHADELGLDAESLRALRQDLQQSRRRNRELRDAMEASRRRFRDALDAGSFDRAAVEARFEDLLSAEAAMKRESLRARLDFVAAIDADQRARVRDAARTERNLRRALRWRIEEIRRRGKALHARGEDTAQLRTRARKIERLIRQSRFQEAMERAEMLLDELPH